MRRWLCCTCQVEESYQPDENEHLKSPRDNGDGMFFYYRIKVICYYYGIFFIIIEKDKNPPTCMFYFMLSQLN